MKPSQVKSLIKLAMGTKLNVMITGKPGIAKTAIAKQAAVEENADLVIIQTSTSEQTDTKGFPWIDKGKATFVPYGQILQLINAKKPTICILDDFGQASVDVQKSWMPLLDSNMREVAGHKISDFVTFVATTNRRSDKAGVQGILAPILSRFAVIVEMESDTNEWVLWAIDNNMPIELIAFSRFVENNSSLFNEIDKPLTNDLVNVYNSRTKEHLGILFNKGIDKDIEQSVFIGAIGQVAGIQFKAFLEMYRTIPDIDQIIINPSSVNVPTAPDVLYAVCGALAYRSNDVTLENILIYAERLPVEFQMVLVTDAVTRTPELTQTSAYIKWQIKHSNFTLRGI